ncbi:MAG: ABC transporter permease [Acidobacteriota bacterium]
MSGSDLIDPGTDSAPDGSGPPVAARPPVQFVRGARAVFAFALPATFFSRRTLFFGLLAGVLPLVAVVFLLVKAIPATEQLREGYIFYTHTFFLVHYIVLLIALFFGTSVVADEIENKTLTYLFVRPVPKMAILLGKATAIWASAALLIGPMLIVTYTLLTLGDGILAENILNAGIIHTERIYSGAPASFVHHLPTLGADLFLTLGVLAVYTAVFTFVGAFFNKPVLWGIALAFGWESWVPYIPALARKLTVMHYVQSLTAHATGKNMLNQVAGQVTASAQAAGTGEAILALLFIFALFGGLSLWTFSHREYIFDLSKQ